MGGLRSVRPAVGNTFLPEQVFARRRLPREHTSMNLPDASELTRDLAPIMTPKTVASFLKLHEKTVRDWAGDGEFPGAFRTTSGPKGRWRITRLGVEAYLRGRS